MGKRKESVEGFIKSVYSNKKQRSRLKGWTFELDREEFRKWMLDNHVEAMWHRWKDSDWERNLFPSIDRIRNEGTYTFDNMQLITWEENYLKGQRDSFNRYFRRPMRRTLKS